MYTCVQNIPFVTKTPGDQDNLTSQVRYAIYLISDISTEGADKENSVKSEQQCLPGDFNVRIKLEHSPSENGKALDINIKKEKLDDCDVVSDSKTHGQESDFPSFLSLTGEWLQTLKEDSIVKTKKRKRNTVSVKKESEFDSSIEEERKDFEAILGEVSNAAEWLPNASHDDDDSSDSSDLVPTKKDKLIRKSGVKKNRRSIKKPSRTFINPNQKLKCGKCKTDFPDMASFKEHYETFHPAIPCSICGKKFYDQAKLDKHQDTHRKVQGFPCSLCDATFDKKIGLKEHIVNVHPGETKIHKCKICQRSFTRSADLTRHQIVHSTERNVSCDECGKLFKHQINLAAHKRTVHSGPVEKVQCSLCGKLVSKISLKQHEISVHGDKIWTCHICSKSFATKHRLIVHERRHSGERPFKCPVPSCNKSFVCKEYIKDHLISHSDEKSVPCPACNKMFKTKATLKAHKKQVHLDLRQFKCQVCTASFNSLACLQRHSNIHTNAKSYVCTTCGKSFNFKESLVNHQRVHTGQKPYGCHVCGLRFMWSGMLSSHMQKDHPGCEIPLGGSKAARKPRKAQEELPSDQVMPSTQQGQEGGLPAPALPTKDSGILSGNETEPDVSSNMAQFNRSEYHPDNVAALQAHFPPNPLGPYGHLFPGGFVPQDPYHP